MSSPDVPLRFHLRHTMLPVTNIEKSVDFYCRLLGMKVLRRRKGTTGEAAYVGYGGEHDATVLELISGTGKDGEPWAGHLAFAVSDMKGFCARLEQEGVRFTRPFNEDKSRPGRMTAIILDPDGFEVELTSFVF